MNALGIWAVRHALVVWLGVLFDVVVAVPLLLSPDWLMATLGFPPVPGLWPRFAGLLILLLSVFSIPATIDFVRYELFAWLAVFPARTLEALFFAIAVFFFAQPYGFLIVTAVAGTVAILSLVCLLAIDSLRRQLGTVPS